MEYLLQVATYRTLFIHKDGVKLYNKEPLSFLARISCCDVRLLKLLFMYDVLYAHQDNEFEKILENCELFSLLEHVISGGKWRYLASKYICKSMGVKMYTLDHCLSLNTQSVIEYLIVEHGMDKNTLTKYKLYDPSFFRPMTLLCKEINARYLASRRGNIQPTIDIHIKTVLNSMDLLKFQPSTLIDSEENPLIFTIKESCSVFDQIREVQCSQCKNSQFIQSIDEALTLSKEIAEYLIKQGFSFQKKNFT